IDLVFACARLGAILVPLNTRLAPPEHQYMLQQAGAELLIADGTFVDHVESVRPGCRLADPDAPPAGSPDFPARGPSANEPREGAARDDAALLLVYTSGTTGRPKGAVLTQSAVLWNAINSTAAFDLTSADRVLTVLPMFHVGGLNIQTLPALHAGAIVELH